MLDHDFHVPDNGPAVVSGFADTVQESPSYPTPGVADVHEDGYREPVNDTVIPEARMDAYIAISGERDYQDVEYPGETNSAETILLVDEFLRRAKESFQANDYEGTAHNVRKIAAIAVRAMEQLGSATRAEEDGSFSCGG